MELPSWVNEFCASITVCDTNGVILEMNQSATKVFAKWGGIKLIGSNLLDCHPESARTKLQDLLKNQGSNAYTIEKNGKKKLIYQQPWFKDGVYGGLVELSLEIPFDMPHFIRK